MLIFFDQMAENKMMFNEDDQNNKRLVGQSMAYFYWSRSIFNMIVMIPSLIIISRQIWNPKTTAPKKFLVIATVSSFMFISYTALVNIYMVYKARHMFKILLLNEETEIGRKASQYWDQEKLLL